MRLLIFFLLIPVLSFSQDTLAKKFKDRILFMNGREEISTILDTNSSNVQYLKPELKEDREASIDKYRIFSINYGGEGEVVFYKKDSAEGNFLSVNEMRYFVYGERDALRSYKAKGSFWGGVLAGYAGGLGAPSAGLSMILSPVVPGLYTIANGSGIISVSKRHVSDEGFLKNDNYLDGYERTGRAIRVQRSLLGGAIGLVLGAGTFLLINR